MRRSRIVGLLLQATGLGLGICGTALDDRQTQLLGAQIRHIGRLRMRPPEAVVEVDRRAAPTRGSAGLEYAVVPPQMWLSSANDSGN